MKTLEDFDREAAEKRARLERDLTLIRALPTAGRFVEWIGEDGWEHDGRTRRPDKAKRIELLPWIVHSPFRGAEHIAFQIPDTLANAGGEHVSSPHRREFERKYLHGLLACFEPYMLETIAVKGRYHSYVPEIFDWATHRDYTDAAEKARGLYVVAAGRSLGKYSHDSGELEFYARTETLPATKISIRLPGWAVSALLPVPRGVTRYSNHGPVSRVESWDRPNTAEAAQACYLIRYGSGDFTRRSSDFRYLFDHAASLGLALRLVENEGVTA